MLTVRYPVQTSRTPRKRAINVFGLQATLHFRAVLL
jgi:hypothetical protein